MLDEIRSVPQRGTRASTRPLPTPPPALAIRIPVRVLGLVLLALVFNVSAYCSEIIRAGILGVPRGQFEAARSLGLKTRIMWLKVILPQAVKIVIPPLIGTFINIIKAHNIIHIDCLKNIIQWIWVKLPVSCFYITLFF